jgi:hypothetical protein
MDILEAQQTEFHLFACLTIVINWPVRNDSQIISAAFYKGDKRPLTITKAQKHVLGFRTDH